ncbi:type II toxin-antitoxin system YoeB family toxin [Nocardia sp. NPDC055053]
MPANILAGEDLFFRSGTVSAGKEVDNDRTAIHITGKKGDADAGNAAIRINRLIDDIARDPCNGLGKPEPLRGDKSGYSNSRSRIVRCRNGDVLAPVHYARGHELEQVLGVGVCDAGNGDRDIAGGGSLCGVRAGHGVRGLGYGSTAAGT